MAIKATRRQPECYRCGKPVKVGDMVESIESDEGSRVFVHSQCKWKTSEIPLEPDYEEDEKDSNGYSKKGPPLVTESIELPMLLIEKARQELSDEVNTAIDKLGEETLHAVDAISVRLTSDLSRQSSQREKELKRQTDKIEERLITLAESIRREKIVIQYGPQEQDQIEVKEDVYHEAFKKILYLAAKGFDFFLHGPAGVGKSFLCEQVANNLPSQDGKGGIKRGRPFWAINCSGGITERHFTGTTTPNLHTGESVFCSTPLVELVEKGGLAFLDEGDALDPNVWVCLNSLMANGYLSLPLRRENPIARRHKDFVLGVAANTTGTGADAEYTARFKLDLSTIDRFAGCMVPVGYSPTIERHICPEPLLLERLWEWRAAIQKAGITRILSTRMIAKAYAFHQDGESLIQIATRMTKDSGWTQDEASAVIGSDMACKIYKVKETE